MQIFLNIQQWQASVISYKRNATHKLISHINYSTNTLFLSMNYIVQKNYMPNKENHSGRAELYQNLLKSETNLAEIKNL